MKKAIFNAFIISVIISISSFAQSGYSIGLVSSNLVNIHSDSKISDVENPYGYGFVLGANISENFTVAATIEYLNGNLENNAGTQKDYRAHISVYATPIKFGSFRPYFSGGAVISNVRTSLINTEEEDTRLFARFGAGIDYQLLKNFALNFDLGIYSDGLRFNGISNSIGLRFIW